MDETFVATGYKYNRKKVLCFLSTKDAGSTLPGTPYVASFPDSTGQLHFRNVERPKLISFFYNHSPIIDNHNQSRQSELRLEKEWVTSDGFFRIETTLIGMTVVDMQKLFNFQGVLYQCNK